VKRIVFVVLATIFVALCAVSCGSKRTAATDESAATKQEIWTTRWMNLGGDAQGDPAICSWAEGRLDVFWRGRDNALKHRWYDNGWSGPENLGGDLRGPPAAVSSELWHIDVFYFDSGSNLVRRYYPDPNWQWATETIPLPAADKPVVDGGTGPAVASWEAGRLDVFWRSAGGLSGTSGARAPGAAGRVSNPSTGPWNRIPPPFLGDRGTSTSFSRATAAS
jgi:hypothetical protein